MLRHIKILLALLIVFTGCTGCSEYKKGQYSLLAGTSWECSENGTILVFSDEHSGLYYCKSATDDVPDTIFSSFDFTYKTSGDEITIEIYLTKRIFVMDGIFDGEVLTTSGTLDQRHYFKIHHKVPV